MRYFQSTSLQKHMNRLFIYTILFLSLPLAVFSQSNIIDEVIWVVGDEAILKSEVEQEKLRAQYNGVPIQGNPYCVIPEQMAIQKLFLHQAGLDSIVANESMVMNQVDMYMNQFVAQIGSKEKLEEYFQKSYPEIREEQREIIRNQMIIQEMQRTLVADIKSTPADIRRFYNSLSEDSIPTIPAQVEVQIITKNPPIPLEETNRIKERLREFTERVNSGTSSFSVLARLYSEDPGSAMQGGELGFKGKGEFVPEFSTVAFNLTTPNKVSRIVETEFGFHIIQLIEKRGNRINCRHILMRPRISLDDKSKAIAQLDSVADQIRSEKITFEQGVIAYSQDKNTAMSAGQMINNKTGTAKFEYQDLPPEVAKVVYNMNVGEISEPFTMMDRASNKEICVIVKVKSKIKTHKANLQDDYQYLKQYLESKKQDEFIHEWIAKKQKDTYISIDDEWCDCEFEYPGWTK